MSTIVAEIRALLKSDRREALATLMHPLSEWRLRCVRDALGVYVPEDFLAREEIYDEVEAALLSRDTRTEKFMSVFCELSGLDYDGAAQVLLSNDDEYGFDRVCRDYEACETGYNAEFASCDTCILRYVFVYSWYFLAKALGLREEYGESYGYGSDYLYYTVDLMMDSVSE